MNVEAVIAVAAFVAGMIIVSTGAFGNPPGEPDPLPPNDVWRQHLAAQKSA